MSRNRKTSNALLWIAQSLLAALFIFAGVMKFVTPVAAMQQGPVIFSGTFLHFIGVCELLGGLGLVLPGIFRVHQYLTPLAAAGLTVIMIGATLVSLPLGLFAALIPFVVGVLAAVVCGGRGGLAYVTSRRRVGPSALVTHS
jgi:uncharacterized membrane protein YphA (DoxX/SURF4 family)